MGLFDGLLAQGREKLGGLFEDAKARLGEEIQKRITPEVVNKNPSRTLDDAGVTTLKAATSPAAQDAVVTSKVGLSEDDIGPSRANAENRTETLFTPRNVVFGILALGVVYYAAKG